MTTPVGSRLEIVTPRQIVFPHDLGYIALTIVLTLGIHLWLFVNSTVTARDGIEFGRLGLRLTSPSKIPVPDGQPKRTRHDVIKDAQHPPGYPVAVLVGYQIVRLWDHSHESISVLRGAQLASVFAAALLVVPTYWLGRMLFSKPLAGFLAALLFQVLPVVAHLLSDALTEAFYLLFGTSALLFIVRGFRHREVSMFILGGIFTGLTYLVRPEGLMLILATGTTIVGTVIFRQWPASLALGRLFAVTMGFFIASVPYMMVIGKLSNKTSVNEFIEKIKGPSIQNRLGGNAANDRPAPLGVMGAFYTLDNGNKVIWAVGAIVKETSKTAHYVPFALALVGVTMLRRQFVTDPGFTVIGVLGLINLSVLAALALNAGYVSERHTIFLVFLTCLFTTHVLTSLEKRWMWLLIAAMILASLPSALKTAHKTRVGHLHAGRFLAEMEQKGILKPNDAIIDPFCWALWYSGRTSYDIAHDPIAPNARWVVMETGESPHSRLPRYPDAVKVLADQTNKAELLFWWPQELPRAEAEKKAKVLVYRQSGDGT
jgi:Dolichyl-phosphate-mannose-protein mannosyltransferase